MRLCFAVLGFIAAFHLVVSPALARPDGSAEISAQAIVHVGPPEKGFFAKRLDYEGIVIIASSNVVVEALLAARDRLPMVPSNLPNARVKLAKAGAEVHIIGRNEVTTDLPDWLHDKGKPLQEYNGLTRDQRTRGMD